MIDNLQAMGVTTDGEFSRLLGVEFGWTKFVGDVVKHKGFRAGAIFEDMVTEIVTSLLLKLSGDNPLTEKVAWCRETSADSTELLNKLKPLMIKAITFRFRDYRRETRFNIGRNEAPKSKDQRLDWLETNATDEHDPGDELHAQVMQDMIWHELNHRLDKHVNSPMLKRLALAMFPDRVEGMGIRELCVKHGTSRGGLASKALSEIISATETVVRRLGDGWMLNMLGK